MQISKNQLVKIKGRFEEFLSFKTVSIGGLIYSSEISKNSITLLNNGKIRLIDNQNNFSSKTLEIVSEPFLVGFENFFNINHRSEVRAYSQCEIININLEDLNEDDYSFMINLCKDQASTFEYLFIFSTLKNLKKNKYLIDPKLSFKEFKKNIKFQNDNITEEDQIIYLDRNIKGFRYGQIINGSIYKKFFGSEENPRIAILKRDFTKNFIEEIEIKKLESIPQDKKLIKNSKNNPLEKEQKKKDSESNTENEFVYSKNKNNAGFELIKANNREESYFACISMLIKYFDMPTRTETIKRGSKIIEDQKKSWSRNLINLLDRFGLSVRIVRLNKDNPLLVPFPSLWIDKKGICNLIIKSNSKFITLYNPIKGLKILDESESEGLLNESPEIITVEVGLNTPKKRFDLAWLLPYVQKFKNQLIEVFAASFLTQLFQLATPLLFQQIIDRVLSKGATEALSPLVVLMIIFSLLEIIFSSLRTFQFVEISNRIDIGIGSAILSRMLKLNARFFDSRPVGELSSRLNELENIRRFLTGTALTVVLDAIFSILYFSVMIFYSPLLTTVVLISVPLLFIVTVGITPITQRLIRLRAEAQARTNAFLVEILGGIHTIKLQNAEFNARRQWEDKHLNAINQGFKAILANTSSSNAGQLINKLSNIAVIGIGAWLVIKNQLTLGQLIAFRIISGYVTQPMLRLSGSWQQFQEMSLSLQRVGDIVNQPLEVLENEDKNIEMPKIIGNIKTKNVGFSYSSSAPPVLNSVDIEIKKGNFVGIVGQSGCGKSSLLKMIPRLYRPTTGKLLIDDFDITKVDLYSLRRQIGFVPQDCMLFEGTVFSNIALGDPEASPEKVVEASKAACAHEFIMTLPFGYGTPIGEKGSGLSGGQRQRVALARMLLEKPNLVVLDEATSALDVDTEKQVVNNLREEFKGKTLLMITHRLSTIVDADNIIVMHEGKVDTTGRHKDLMKLKGRYYALYNSQFNEE